jgi:hypothetical protein
MDSAASHLADTSRAWRHVAATHGDESAPDCARSTLAGTHRPAEDVTQLRARLLRMIVDNEHSRKTAAAEAFNAR